MIELSRIQRLYITVCSDLKKSYIYIYIYIYPITKEERIYESNYLTCFCKID